MPSTLSVVATSLLGTAADALICVRLAVPAWAQQSPSGIAGVVRDTSGGVLPGVTVEAASPALIERVRSVVTDGEGRYNIVDLRPGTYTVTFTLTGFSTFRREGIDLMNLIPKDGGNQFRVTVTGTLQNNPGLAIAANYAATAAEITPSLGRQLRTCRLTTGNSVRAAFFLAVLR